VNIGRGTGIAAQALAAAVVAASGQGRIEVVGDDGRSEGLVLATDTLRAMGIWRAPRELHDALAATAAWYQGPTRAA
jgi:hypothetical protein